MKNKIYRWVMKNNWVDKQNMVHNYSGILFSLKKEEYSYTHYKIYEPWKHYPMWHKPDTRD